MRIDDRLEIETPEGALLTLSLAGPVTRAMAYGIDLLLRLLIFAIVALLLSLAGKAGTGLMLITLFLLVSAPVTANFLAKVFINQQTKPKDLPVPGDCNLWATHNKPEHRSADTPEA